MQDIAGRFQQLLEDDLNDVENSFDTPLTEVNKQQIRKSLVKKWRPDITVAAETEGLRIFMEANNRSGGYTCEPADDFEKALVGQVQKIWDDCVFRGPEPVFGFREISRYLNVGPGANVGAKSKAFYIKVFASPLTATSDHLYRLYKAAISDNASWCDAERLRHQEYGFRVVPGSKLFHAPKESLKTRIATTVPTLNMMFQKGISSCFFEPLLWRRWKIDLSNQPEKNKTLARRGSRFRVFGTIDLSSASDCISMSLVRKIFPAYLLHWLELIREDRTILPDGSELKLNMVSTMGNGFTFSMETALFASIVEAVYSLRGIPLKRGRRGTLNFGVFGDDIIVRRDVYDDVVKALKLFGFLVNEDKSFNDGPFRESCGGDYWNGTDVRGVYLKKLSQRQDSYSAINRLVRWCARTGIMLPRLISYLRTFVMDLPVPYEEGDKAGIKKPLALVQGDQIAYCPRLMAFKYRANRPKTVSIRFPEPRSDDEIVDSAHIRYVYSRGQIVSRKRANGRYSGELFYNPSGLLISFVGGYIRSGGVTVPYETDAPHQIVWVSTSRWDRYVDASQGGSWQAAAARLLA